MTSEMMEKVTEALLASPPNEKVCEIDAGLEPPKPMLDAEKEVLPDTLALVKIFKVGWPVAEVDKLTLLTPAAVVMEPVVLKVVKALGKLNWFSVIVTVTPLSVEPLKFSKLIPRLFSRDRRMAGVCVD